MNAQPPTVPAKVPGLADLAHVALNPPHQQLLDRAAEACWGPLEWRHRKRAEGHDLLALAQLSNRLVVQQLDLFDDLRALVLLRVPVPCLPDPRQLLQVAPLAVLGLIYRYEALRQPQPGYSFVQILAPPHIHHANVSLQHGQILCLGPQLPAGIPLKEIVLMTYGALSMQSVQMDALDPAGTLNPLAGEWWQRNGQLIPLTREPFIKPLEVQA